MARPGFRNHPKFRRLTHVLEIPAPHVLGLCEFLWSVAYESGDPTIGDAVDVELAAGWTGNPGALCDALLKCGGDGRAGLIEAVPEMPGRFQIHDLADHAPDYVKCRARMEAYRRRKNTDEPERSETVTQRLRNGDGSPAPAPAPAPSNTAPQCADSAPRIWQDEEPAVLVFKCAGKQKTWNLVQSFIDSLHEQFPNVDILLAAKQAKGWTETNPMKTAKGMPNFLRNWMSKEQDRPKKGVSTNGHNGKSHPTSIRDGLKF